MSLFKPTGFLTCLVLVASLFLGLSESSTPARAGGSPGDFDFYVLALSWSPTYCASRGRNADPLQCRATKPFRFIVHGLWPQYERGYPDFCRSRQDGLDRGTVNDMLDIMPSRSLVAHQWRKHGSCSGLDADEYFDMTRRAFEKIRIPAPFQSLDRTGRIAPDAVEKAFRISNPGLRDAAMAVTCSNGTLQEVRICLDKDLNFRGCRAVDRSGCRAGKISVPSPAR
ncbi:ribonuclease T2 family protein [Roseibium sp.]|uniref:ribonuclease T2 family protein n=1 Tax=Roseibium sp. TaxID=1936156 RepID=UPI003A988357